MESFIIAAAGRGGAVTVVGAARRVPDTGGVHDGVSDVVLFENAGKQMGKWTWGGKGDV